MQQNKVQPKRLKKKEALYGIFQKEINLIIHSGDDTDRSVVIFCQHIPGLCFLCADRLNACGRNDDQSREQYAYPELFTAVNIT